MRPHSMSASSAKVWQSCPAMWKVKYIGDRPPDDSGSAATFGTALHAVLEEWVVKKHYSVHANFTVMKEIWERVYRDHFDDQERLDEGTDILLKWHKAQDWEGRTILCAEQKLNFPLRTSLGEIPFNYVFDRADRLDNGDVEITDYKSYMMPMTPDQVRLTIQARSYALAGAILYPDAPKIWVTFDLLRHGRVGVVFNRDDNVETWKYLHHMIEEIITSDGTTERPNPDCRYCPRQFACRGLRMIENIGGVLSLDDPLKVIDQRAALQYASKAMEDMIKQLDEHLLRIMEEQEVFSLESEDNIIVASARGRRSVDARAVADILGPDLMARFGAVKLSDIDDLVKGKDLTDDQKSQLKQSIRSGFNSPSISVKPKEH